MAKVKIVEANEETESTKNHSRYSRKNMKTCKVPFSLNKELIESIYIDHI